MAVGESSPTAGQADDLSRAWIDRDISWLEFNRRVLHEALDERTPLLERVRFLGIFNSNLDVIDDAFEYLVNQSSKGEKGQYFTPRWVIDLCVKMLNPDEDESDDGG